MSSNTNQDENVSKAQKLLSLSNEQVDVSKVIADLIKIDFGGSNEEQLKAVQLMKGLATSDDPKSDKFMQKINSFTSGLDPKEFEEAIDPKQAKKALALGNALDTLPKFRSNLDDIIRSSGTPAKKSIEVIITGLQNITRLMKI